MEQEMKWKKIMKSCMDNLCNLAPYRVMGEDRHALFPITQSNDPIFYEEFDEVHYGLWAKVLTDEEYQEIVDAVTKNE